MTVPPGQPIPLHFVWTYTDVDRRFWEEHLAEWLPDRLFDAHVHVNDPRLRLAEPSEEKKRQYWVNELDCPIGCDALRRCYSVVFPGRKVACLAFGHPSLEYDIEASHARLREEVRPLGWPLLAVTRPSWSAETVDALLRQENVIGVKPYYALIGNDPETRDRYLEADILDYLPPHQLAVLDRHKAWVTLHVPKADRLGHPDNIRQIREIRERYPAIQLVIAHLGRCYAYETAREALAQLQDDPGLFFDNSAVLNPEVHRYALELFGPRRILYGTDNPIFFMRGRRQWRGRSYINRTSYPFHFNKEREAPEVEAGYTLYMYEALRAIRRACEDLSLSKAEIDLVFRGNAVRLAQAVKDIPAGA